MPGSVLARRKARGSVARACFALATTAMAVAVALPSGASAEVPPYSLPVTLPTPKQSPPSTRTRHTRQWCSISSISSSRAPRPPAPSSPTRASSCTTAQRGLSQRRPGLGPDRYQPEHRADLLDRCPGRPEHLWPEHPRVDRPNDADGPWFVLRSAARQRLGPDRGHRVALVHGHRPLRPADRPRPPSELEPQPDHDGRGLLPQPRDGRDADPRHPGRRNDVADEALRRLQRPEPERQHRHRRPAAARELPAALRGGFVDARAAAGMCSYQIFRDTSTHLPARCPR